ncbi:MAG: hypothetical protein Ta2F_06250 [Termitinemataceae bacterium]|nr:MAG: hypothetical protein Ta2F_06250 [Termitinemataceae bacterium]
MQDLGIVEIIIAFFLFLYLIRPFFKSLRQVNGLVLFPPLALFCCVALFFVYGFRPECLPLLLSTLIINIANFPALSSIAAHLNNSDYMEQSIVTFLICFIISIASVVLALQYAPLVPDVLLTEKITSINLKNRTNAQNGKRTSDELFVRIYDPENEEEKSNVIFVIPPVYGSVITIDLLCGALRDHGFRVVTYSKKGFDFFSIDDNGKRYAASLSNIKRIIKSLDHAWKNKSANIEAVYFEEQRAKDMLFLFDFIETSIHPENIFIIAYNEGGSALLKNINSFSETNTSLYQATGGIIAIEPLFFSSYITENAVRTTIYSKDIFDKINAELKYIADKKKTKKITQIGDVPEFSVPVLFLMSDNINTQNKNRYGAAIKTIEKNASFANVQTVEGAGPLDYSDIPPKYPVISNIFKGSGEKYDYQDPPDHNGHTDRLADLMLDFIEKNLEEKNLEKNIEENQVNE